MSHMAKVENVAFDQKHKRALVFALQDMYGAEYVEVHDEGSKMVGFAGKQGGTAHIIVRKEHYGGYGDLGFVLENGTYSMVKDVMDHALNMQEFVTSYIGHAIKSSLAMRQKYRVLNSSKGELVVQQTR